MRFKADIADADALLFVTPEHSRSIPAVLKSAIDWGARPWGKNSWTGKPAAVTGTSPARSAPRSRSSICAPFSATSGVLVMGGEAYITFKPELVDADDNVTDESTRKFLKTFLDQLAALTAKLTAQHAPRAAA